jgi:glycosyltransferase involved in cell wall biosynthesis
LSILFTVFTPTYNRAHTLSRVYESLKAQTFGHFEWLIIDDGSTDETLRLVTKWEKESSLSIRYVYQQHSGKHIAFNRGVRNALGELFVEVDSDDAIVPEALERFKYYWNSIPSDQRDKFVGVCSLCQDQQGSIIGTRFPINGMDSDSLEIQHRYKVRGEKFGFNRLSVLKQFPFPEIPDVAFIPEGFVWSQIARQYRTRFINEPLRIYYTDDVNQLSAKGSGNAVRHAQSHALWHLSILNQDIFWFRYNSLHFIRSAVHYTRFSFNAGTRVLDQVKALNNCWATVLWVIFFSLGFLIYLIDQIEFRIKTNTKPNEKFAKS